MVPGIRNCGVGRLVRSRCPVTRRVSLPLSSAFFNDGRRIRLSSRVTPPGPADVEQFSSLTVQTLAFHLHPSRSLAPSASSHRTSIEIHAQRSSRPHAPRRRQPIRRRVSGPRRDDSHLSRLRPAATGRAYPRARCVASSSSPGPQRRIALLGRPDGVPGEALGFLPADWGLSWEGRG